MACLQRAYSAPHDLEGSKESRQNLLVEEFAKRKEAFVTAFWEPDTRNEVLMVLERAADDRPLSLS
jgi:hypothetical protein